MKSTRLITVFLLFLPLKLMLSQSAFASDSSIEKSANAERLLALGLRYEKADGVEQDYMLARQYYEEAIEAGSVMAIHNLGALYNWGLGVSVERPRALQLWEQASAQGNMYSSFNMGNAFLNGNGRNQDTMKALDYYMLSYEQGFDKSICQYAEVLLDVNASNSEKTRRLLEPLAREGNTQCLSALVGLLYDDFEQHQDAKSLLFWTELGASKGLTHSTFVLALIYDFGEKGVSPDAEKAKSYYLKAAQLSHESAYANLGFMYESGKFGNPDAVMAKYYYEKAVAIGSQWGLNNLATFYRDGIGKVIDFEKAFSLYTQSANMGNAYAHRNLGIMYRLGKGVTPDAYLAEKHLMKSVELGYPQALLDTGLLYLDKSLPLYDKATALMYFYQAVDKQVPNALEVLTEQFAEEEREWLVMSQISGQIAYDLAAHYQAKSNQVEACKWFLVAFKRHQEDAYLDVMPCVKERQYPDMPYLDQLDVAREWAAHQKWDANSLIGELYFYGETVDIDKEQAASYFLQAHEHSGDEIARYKLGLMYLVGDGVEKDVMQAKYFFELAANQGLSVAALELGKLYRHGKGVTADATKAFEYTRKAAEYLDSGESAFSFANMLYEGFGQEQNIRLAIDWYDRAIQLGYTDASCQLSRVLASHYANPEEQIRAEQLRQWCD
ncbi:tetratricopeptide repeat protein [Pseudoalteromonas sp. T1lg75]|uniref:tetratricopeptide repeat protein n=1 Tax=Pseudoalteromonas sp. T1lg75 TaxID=2077102 RepID=UPI001319F778|nr:SEL1-like repeat protein [Pseudoalteromonas sp. T1lg75]